jgi:hypothetical protein
MDEEIRGRHPCKLSKAEGGSSPRWRSNKNSLSILLKREICELLETLQNSI